MSSATTPVTAIEPLKYFGFQLSTEAVNTFIMSCFRASLRFVGSGQPTRRQSLVHSSIGVCILVSRWIADSVYKEHEDGNADNDKETDVQHRSPIDLCFRVR
jgi:hypothetical protein